MLDFLLLLVETQCFAEIIQSPEMEGYTPLQFLREVLEPQYTEVLNNRFQTDLGLSSLINKGAQVENLKIGNGWINNATTAQQVLEFHSARCVEACRRNYRCKFVDCSDLLDELIILNVRKI